MPARWDKLVTGARFVLTGLASCKKQAVQGLESLLSTGGQLTKQSTPISVQGLGMPPELPCIPEVRAVQWGGHTPLPLGSLLSGILRLCPLEAPFQGLWLGWPRPQSLADKR